MSTPQPTSTFVLFGRLHVGVLLGIAGLALCLPLGAGVVLTPELRVWVARALALLMAGTILWWTLERVRAGALDPTVDLPVDLCNLLPCSRLLRLEPVAGIGTAIYIILG